MKSSPRAKILMNASKMHSDAQGKLKSGREDEDNGGNVYFSHPLPPNSSGYDLYEPDDANPSYSRPSNERNHDNNVR